MRKTVQLEGLYESPSGEYESVRGDIVSKLRELGLSSYGARAFLAIVEKQPASATDICKRTNIPDSKIYYALKELDERRLIIVQRGTPSTYKLSRSKQILSGLESKLESEYKQRVESLRKVGKSLEVLAARSSGPNSSDMDLAYIVKGFRNVVEKMKEAALQARREIVFMASDEKLIRCLEQTFEGIRNERDVSIKIAIAAKLLNSNEFRTRLKPNRTLSCQCNVLVIDSKKLVSAELLPEKENQYGIVAQNQSMVDLMRRSYDNPSCCC